MEKRFAELEQSVDPHFGWGEGVAPGDDTGAVGGSVRLKQGGANLFRTSQDGLEDEFERQGSRGVELVNDALGVSSDLLERSLSVEVLRAGKEPDFGGIEVFHKVK